MTREIYALWLENNEKLIAKTAAIFDERNQAKVSFSLMDNAIINGRIEVSDTGLSYDNELFFNINPKEKIKVLIVGGSNGDYLRRIYNEDEFQFSSYNPSDLNYGLLESQNLITNHSQFSSKRITFLYIGGRGLAYYSIGGSGYSIL